MLPTPKKVADLIRKTLFQSAEEKQQEVELNRDIKIRMGMTRIRRHISQQKEMVRRLTGLAKQSLKINDEARFRQIGKQLLQTRQDILRWEKYVLSLEMLSARRDQVKASVDVLQAVKAMSESFADLAGPEKLTDLHLELEKGLAQAGSLDERLEIMMDMMDSAMGGESLVDEGALKDLESSLSESVAGEESSAFEKQIEDGLRSIRKEMEDEKK